MTFDTFLPSKDIFNQPKLIRTDGSGIEKSQLECQKVGGLTFWEIRLRQEVNLATV